MFNKGESGEKRDFADLLIVRVVSDNSNQLEGSGGVSHKNHTTLEIMKA
jgi:hypothetical protein